MAKDLNTKGFFDQWTKGGAKPVDFYADLRDIHIENGVMGFCILALTIQFFIMLSFLPSVVSEDIYVVEGVSRSGTSAVNWGVEANETDVADVNRLYAESLQRRADQLAAERAARETAAALAEGIDDLPARTTAPLSDPELPDGDTGPVVDGP